MTQIPRRARRTCISSFLTRKDVTYLYHQYEKSNMKQTPMTTPRIMESRRRRDLIMETSLFIPGIVPDVVSATENTSRRGAH